MEFSCGIISVVEATLLITAGLYFAVIEDIVHIKIEIERHLAVHIDHLTNACIEHESVAELLLGGDFLGEAFHFGFVGADCPQVGHCLVTHRRDVHIAVAHPRAVDVEEPHTWGSPVDADVVGLLRG